MNLLSPSSPVGATRSCNTGPSGRYIRTGTLRTLYALSATPGESLGGERGCSDDWAAGGCCGDGDDTPCECDEGVAVGQIFDAIRQ
jgi:hypothetical protein